MKEHKLITLLKRWNAVAPKECLVSYPYENCPIAFHVPCFPDLGVGGKTVSFCTEFDLTFDPYLWELQGVVQMYIQRRGFEWGLGIANRQYSAQIFLGTDEEGMALDPVADESGDLPVYALLESYLLVIEKPEVKS